MSAATLHEEDVCDFSVAGKEGYVEDTQDLDFPSSDYATRLEEALGQSHDEEEDDDFLYQGEDSQEASGTYSEQLQTFLQGLDDDTRVTDLEEERQVEEQLKEESPFVYEEVPQVEALSGFTLSTESSPSLSLGANSTVINDSLSRSYTIKTFLHPNISRLRSFGPTVQNRASSVSSHPTLSPSPSHLSAISRSSSISNPHAASDARDERHEEEREAFCWAALKDISQQIYLKKATSILGSFHGLPTVLAANGLICVGTDRGRVLVFDFQQRLRCVCGSDDTLELAGPVSALSLSHDHNYVAAGHSRGHIHLYDISRPQVPARSVPPTSLSAVSSGRTEGHIEGTKILSLAFVGARHTAIVSADEYGLAFYHSLGKVLFVEANDTLRILGIYPSSPSDLISPEKAARNAEATSRRVNGEESVPSNPPRPRPWKPRKDSTILAMTSLPLGTITHPTEAYNLIALLTPTKLVLVGLKPTPRTWFRRHRQDASGIPFGASKWRGCLAWFPSVDPDIHTHVKLPSDHVNGKHNNKPKATQPVLAYSWDRTLHILRVSEVKITQTMQSAKNPDKKVTVEVGKIEAEEVARWSSESDYLAIQWLNVYQLLALTASYFEVWDIRSCKRVECVPFNMHTLLPFPASGGIPQTIAHSVRVYKGKVFLLGRQELKVGTLLSWADRILAFVEDGDFLKAIETACSYFLGTAPGNRMGLPDDRSALRSLVGNRMRDLMTASSRYAFADERMTDGTHVTPDGRGVDRTSLFEGLVTVCTKSCIALDDFSFLFEDLFDEYDDAGIAPIFLAQLEPFVLAGALRSIPPRITKRLIGIHEEQGDLGKAEQIIWHIDPDCLDINQAITLCRSNGLYDALIYVHTRSLHDFVTPMVELLELVLQIQRDRRALSLRSNGIEEASTFPAVSSRSVESSIPDAYKLYTYLADILSGLTYPSQIPMPQDEALRAKTDIYQFLFKGLSYAPTGAGGRLILTSDEEGGIEQTYPYVRLLLRFDAEAFLHTMDIAFEDSYFNDESPEVDRLVIVRILLEILSTPGLSSFDTTMLNIFIARNVPKYPQSIPMAPSILHDVLVNLAEDLDQSTREDRQLAAEYLLSVYSPHDSEKMMDLFDDAGFFRILRNWYQQEHKWGPLISTYLRDPDIATAGIFHDIDEVLTKAFRADIGTLPGDVSTELMDALPQLLNCEITETALLIDKHMPNSHAQVLETFDSPHKQLAYLRCLLEPSALPDDLDRMSPTLRRLLPSGNLSSSSRELYLKLLCRLDSSGVIRCLEQFKEDFFDWDAVVSICEQNGVNDAVIWSLDKRGNSEGAFQKLEHLYSSLSSALNKHLISEEDGAEIEHSIQRLLDELAAVGNISLRICNKHSTSGGDVVGSTVEDMWFRLLSSQIDTVQAVSSCCSCLPGNTDPSLIREQRVLEFLRSLVHTTFKSLMRLGTSSAPSFPRLFKRLVDSTSNTRSSGGSSYSEFRLILTGMLDLYRGEGDLLLITNRLVERDLFAAVEELAKCRERGSKVRGSFCTLCGGSLQRENALQPARSSVGALASLEMETVDWLIQRFTGLPYHRRCLSPVTDTLL